MIRTMGPTEYGDPTAAAAMPTLLIYTLAILFGLLVIFISYRISQMLEEEAKQKDCLKRRERELKRQPWRWEKDHLRAESHKPKNVATESRKKG